MAFGRSDREESGGTERRTGNRPDCAYFLLLGLCGAAFLLTIGGILTYIAFNPGSIDTRPHSPLSHIPHFHHHRKHHDRTEGHYFGHFEQHTSYQQHHEEQNNVHHQQPHHLSTSSSSHSNIHSMETTTEKVTTNLMAELKPTIDTIENRNDTRPNGHAANGSGAGESVENGTTPGNHSQTSRLNEQENKTKENDASSTSASLSPVTSEASETRHEAGKGVHEDEHQQNNHSGLTHHNYNKNNSSHHHHPLLDPSSSHHMNQQQPMHPHTGVLSSVTHHGGNNSSGYEYQAKQSLALAIIGPLCLLMGIIVTLIVGVFALKYDCDHEPEPNIAFLRLRSEMSLNFDPSKNNYELLMPASSSSAGVGSTHSIHPGGMPRC